MFQFVIDIFCKDTPAGLSRIMTKRVSVRRKKAKNKKRYNMPCFSGNGCPIICLCTSSNKFQNSFVELSSYTLFNF